MTIKSANRDVIEMSFWMLSFLEKFEKEFESSQKRIAQGWFVLTLLLQLVLSFCVFGICGHVLGILARIFGNLILDFLLGIWDRAFGIWHRLKMCVDRARRRLLKACFFYSRFTIYPILTHRIRGES